MVEKKKSDVTLTQKTPMAMTPLSSTEMIVNDYFKTKLKDKKVSDEDKRLFLMTCVTNKLNPFKGEIYPLTFHDNKTGMDTLTPVIDYKFYIQRGEESGQVDGRKTELKTENKKVLGGKITIYRKGRSYPFELELSFDDVAKPYGMRNTNPSMMMRKQLIREGFKLCFPGSVKEFVDNEQGEVINIQDTPIEQSDDDWKLGYLVGLLADRSPGRYENFMKVSENMSKKDVIDGLKTILLGIVEEIGLSDEEYEKIKAM